VLAALHARDADAAEALMRKHINAAHAIRLRQLRADGNVLAETYPGGSGL
jgi:DNA-binding GntR family transcriptional regulator